MVRGWRQWFGLRASEMLPQREAYALWAETYPPHPHNPLMVAEQAVVAPIIEAASPSRALDVGTGTGRYLTLLASAGARFVVGVDMSLPMLEHRRCRTPRVCGDACRLPFSDSSFDLVCASLMVGDIADLRLWTAEANRVLIPGGHLVYSDFHPSWSAQQWRRTFRAADGRQFELPYVPHTIDEHLQHLEDAALEIRVIREPRIAGRSTPVVAVFHAVKPAPATMRPRSIRLPPSRPEGASASLAGAFGVGGKPDPTSEGAAVARAASLTDVGSGFSRITEDAAVTRPASATDVGSGFSRIAEPDR